MEIKKLLSEARSRIEKESGQIIFGLVDECKDECKHKNFIYNTFLPGIGKVGLQLSKLVIENEKYDLLYLPPILLRQSGYFDIKIVHFSADLIFRGIRFDISWHFIPIDLGDFSLLKKK